MRRTTLEETDRNVGGTIVRVNPIDSKTFRVGYAMKCGRLAQLYPIRKAQKSLLPIERTFVL